MANVVFKRGTQANFNANIKSNAQDGVFYLTTDTHRLYVGTTANTAQLLNQVIEQYASVAALNAAVNGYTADQKEAHVGDFFYCKAENVLITLVKETSGTNTDYRWVQINPDHNTYIEGIEVTSSASGDTGYVNTIIEQSQENSDLAQANTYTTATFNISVQDGLSVSAATAGLALTGNLASATRTVADNVATMSVLNSNSTATSDIRFIGAGNVTVSSTGTNGIVINATDDFVAQAELSLDSNNDITLELTRDKGGAVSATLANVGVILDNGNSTQSYIKLGNVTTNGASAMSVGEVYSKAAIDSLLKGLNGMTYKGNISATTALPTSGVSAGDVWVVGAKNLSISSATYQVNYGDTFSGTPIIGDMFIASGTEGSDGTISGTVTWNYVPSGNEDLASTHLSGEVDTATHALKVINDGNSTYQFGVRLAATSGVTISSQQGDVDGGQGVSLVTTISHATISSTSTTADASSKTSFSAISGITLDNGHVTAVETETFTPVAYRFVDTIASSTVAAAVSATSNNATIAINLGDEDENVYSSTLFNISSSNLKITASANAVVVNMEWESF